MNEQTIIFLGPQGSGKGTQVARFKKFLAERDPDRRVVHLDMGGALRTFMAEDEDNYTRSLVRASMARGEFQPAFITCYMMAHILFQEMRGDEHFIIDGFPRELKQAVIFDTAMDFYQRAPRIILNIKIPEEESVKRLLARGRVDDTEAGIRERLRWNREQVEPMIEQYRKNTAYRVVDIDGKGTVEEVHDRILQALALK